MEKESQGNPSAGSLEEEVRTVIESEIRPQLQGHGGDIEFVDIIEDAVVRVRLQGACAGCPHARATLKNGVEVFLREKVPSVKEVQEVE